MKNLLKKHADKVRFIIVGTITTIIDFGILFALVAFGLPAIASNFVSTFFASIFNFFAHKNYTYNDNEKTSAKHVVGYIIVTVIGIWAIQPVVIWGATAVLGPWFTANTLVVRFGNLLGPLFQGSYLVLLIAKCLAIGAAMVWNFFLYRKYVFNKAKP